MIIPVTIMPLPWQPLFPKSTFDNFNMKFLKMQFRFKFLSWNASFKQIINIFNVFFINFRLILSSFWIFQKIQDGGHEINMASYDIIMTS